MPSEIGSVGIWGIGAAVPDRVLTNADLEKMVETSDEWIRTRSGISERRIKEVGEATSDYAAKAAKIAMERAEVRPEDIDLLICATCTPDERLPAAACRIQQKLGLRNIPSFDLVAACTGFVYGLALGKQTILGGMAKRVLLIGADMISSITNYEDRGTCVLFGDAAGAAVLGPVSEGRGILSEYLAADGSNAELLWIPAGGSRLPTSPETMQNGQQYIQMKGSEIFKLAVRIMGDSIEKALEKAGMTTDDLDWVVPHQANFRIIEGVAKRLKTPMERVIVNIEKYGNSSASTIPLALHEATSDGRIKDGDTLAMAAFGAGLTWGSVLMRWGR